MPSFLANLGIRSKLVVLISAIVLVLLGAVVADVWHQSNKEERTLLNADENFDKEAFLTIEKYRALQRATAIWGLASEHAAVLQRRDEKEMSRLMQQILQYPLRDPTGNPHTDYAALRAPDGRVLAIAICDPREAGCSKQWKSKIPSPPDVSAVLDPQNPPVLMTTWEIDDDHVYTIFVARVTDATSSKILGTLSIGYLLDAEAAKKAQERLVGEAANNPAKRAGIEVVIWHYAGVEPKPHLLGVSNPALEDVLSKKLDDGQGPGRFEFNSEEYSFTPVHLPTARQVPALTVENPRNVQIGLVESITERMQPINNLMRDLAALAICALLISVGLGLVLSRPIVNPLVGLANVARDVEQGKYDSIQELRLRNRRKFESLDEIGTLCRTFEQMVAGLNHRRAMSKFLSQTAYSSLQDCGTCSTDRKWMVVLFSDIRDFTSYSEGRDPQSVVQRLNEVLGIQAEIVSRHGGDIDKFIGDAMVAWFTGADRCHRAVKAAREMLAELATRVGECAGGQVGVGIHVGEVIVGALGSPNRLDYTAIGSTVNLASRLCSAAKRGQILISQAVFTELGNSVPLHPLEPIHAKGFAEPVQVYEVVPEVPAGAAAPCEDAAKATAG